MEEVVAFFSDPGLWFWCACSVVISAGYSVWLRRRMPHASNAVLVFASAALPPSLILIFFVSAELYRSNAVAAMNRIAAWVSWDWSGVLIMLAVSGSFGALITLRILKARAAGKHPEQEIFE